MYLWGTPPPQNIFDRLTPVFVSKERSPDTIRTPFFSFCRFAPALSRFALRYLVQRLVRGHALRLHDLTAEGQARADIRTRIRGIVTRIRTRDTATRVRIVAPAIDHTALMPN